MSSIYNTITQMESNTNRLNYERGRANLGSDQLDKASFLQLLLAQLKYQDPTDPISNEQFVQQQATFTQIDKLDQLNKTLTTSSQISQAGGMVGKYVEVGYTPDGATEPEYSTGLVDSVVISNGTVGLKIGDLIYNLDQVTQIYSSNPNP